MQANAVAPGAAGAVGTVTSIHVPVYGRISHSAVAQAWLRPAPSPQASTAPIQRASRVSGGWPTA